MRYPLCFLVATQLFAAWPDQLTQGNLRYERGLYREAVVEYERALRLAETPQHRALTLCRLALAHGRLADFAAAEQDYKEAVTIFRSSGDSRGLASALAGLGEVYRDQYRLDDALATENHSLKILKRFGLLETREAATVFTVTGEILHDQHHLKASQRAMQQAASIIEKIAGPNHAEFATSLNNLGVVVSEQNRAREAAALLERALSIREANFGPEHPLVASTLLNLSSVYLEQKDYARAEQTCRRSLDMMQRFLPATHPDLIKGYMWLALIARRSGDSAAALGILEKAVGTQGATITREYVQLLNLYAQCLGDTGEAEKSRQFRMEARQLMERSDWKSPTRSTVTLGELEAGSLR